MTHQTLLIKAIGYALVAVVWAVIIGLPLAWWLGGVYGSPWPWGMGAVFGLAVTGFSDWRAWLRRKGRQD